MVLKAIGKFIDTLPIADLLSQEEVLADTVVFEVDRWYNGMDLAEFTFHMRGVTESGGETLAELAKEVDTEVIRLHWNVGLDFTTEAGNLALDLFACDAVEAEDPPSHVIRYQLPYVRVRGLPESESILETHSYTDFLMQVKETANDAIAIIEKMVKEFEDELVDYEAHVVQLERKVKENADAIAALTPIVTLTQSEFDALEEPQDGTLYVVKQDA